MMRMSVVVAVMMAWVLRHGDALVAVHVHRLVLVMERRWQMCLRC